MRISAKEFENVLLDIFQRESYSQKKLQLKSNFIYDWYKISNKTPEENSYLSKFRNYIKTNFPQVFKYIKHTYNSIKY